MLIYCTVDLNIQNPEEKINKQTTNSLILSGNMKNSHNYMEYLWEGDVKVFYHWPGYVDVKVSDNDKAEKYLCHKLRGILRVRSHRDPHPGGGEGREGVWLLEPRCLSHIHWMVLLGLKRWPDYRQTSRILPFYSLFTFQLSHTPFPQLKIWTTLEKQHCSCKLQV